MQSALFNSPIFETILCMVLIYALLSLLVSTITEALNNRFQVRGSMLYKTISSLFNDNLNVNFGQLIYSHPMIANLKKDINSLPQYISADMFSNATIDVVSNYAREYKFNKHTNKIELNIDSSTVFQRFKSGILKMYHTDLKIFLLNMAEKAESEIRPLEKLKELLESWYNDQMDRTTGWYKIKVRRRLFQVSICITLLLNIDSIHIFQTIYRSPDLRAQLVPIADNLADNYSKLKNDSSITALNRAYTAYTNSRNSFQADSVTRNADTRFAKNFNLVKDSAKAVILKRDSTINALKSQMDVIADLSLPLGWSKNQPPVSWFRSQSKLSNISAGLSYFENYKQTTFAKIVIYLLGIMISVFSLSAGAPFWFDLLLKFVNIRRAGLKPNTNKN